MAFTPRSFTEILADMISYVQSRTDVNDFSVGSTIRTLLEAAALEDDEQYFQMVQLLDIFSYTTASGEDLDRRLADFNIVREAARAAVGKVKFYDSNLVFDQVATDTAAGAVSLKVFDSTKFPTTGFPYVIRVGEGTIRVQDLTVTALTTANNTFTVSTPLDTNKLVGDRVSLVTGAASHTINSNTVVQAPATNTEQAKGYSTQEPAFIVAGNYYSNEVRAKAVATGSNTSTSLGRVTRFQGSAPFSGAGVTNTTEMAGGRDREKDEVLRARGVNKIQSLSRGTPLALLSGAVGVTDTATGQRVISANLIEDFDRQEVTVYVDDGTGLEADIQPLPQNSLAALASIGAVTVTLNDGSKFPSSGFVLFGTSELKEYISKPGTNVLQLASALTASQAAGTIVRFVSIVSESAEAAQQRFRLRHYPIVRNTEQVYIKAPLDVSWTLLVRDVDYLLNRGIGDFKILDDSGLTAGTEVVAFYNYYTNLVAKVQKTLEGDPDDRVTYPGIKAAGVFLSVEAPIIRRISVRATITAEDTYEESALVASVQREIETYISSLKVGEDVIRTKIIDAAHNVDGVRDIQVIVPIGNITVLENEVPVPYDVNENSLVTIL